MLELLADRCPLLGTAHANEAPRFAQADRRAKPDEIHQFMEGRFGNGSGAEMPDVAPPNQKVSKLIAKLRIENGGFHSSQKYALTLMQAVNPASQDADG